MLAWLNGQNRQFARLWSPAPDTRIRFRLRLPIFILLVLLLLALLTPDRIWTTLLVGLTGLVAIAYWWTWSLASGLSGSRRLQYGWIAVGDQLQEEFAVANRSGVPALWVEVTDESSVPGYNAAVVHSIGARDHVRWRQRSICARRGQFKLGPWSLRTGDPFGLFEVTRRYETSEEIIIHPPIISHLPVPLPPGESEGRARTVSRAWQATVNAAGVRDYQPQDPYHHIHWRTSARRDQLYVRLFDRDASGDIWLVIDGDASVHLNQGNQDGTEEQSVLLAASLAARALAEMRPVGLAVYGHQPQIVPPALGQTQQWAILRALALMRADGITPLGRAIRDLAEITRRGSAAIIITPSDVPDWLPNLATLERSGVESHVLLLERSSFDTAAASQSEGLQRALNGSGFRCQLLRRENIGQPLLPAERHGYWEFKVTGTGKAIATRRPSD